MKRIQMMVTFEILSTTSKNGPLGIHPRSRQNTAWCCNLLYFGLWGWKKRIKWFTSRRSRILSSEMILFTMCTMYFCTRHINRYQFTFLLWQHFFQIVLWKLEHKDSSLRVRSALHDRFPTVKCKYNVNSIRGRAQTTWTIFWTFLTPPPPLVDSFT